MGNWIPGDPTLVAQILKISSAYSPPPPDGFVSPMTWGVEENVIARFESAGIPHGNISFSKETYTFNMDAPPSGLLGVFKDYYGPTMNAFAAAESSGRAGDLLSEMESLFKDQNVAVDPGTTSIPATFLRVTVAVD
jgi:hypothetical protein